MTDPHPADLTLQKITTPMHGYRFERVLEDGTLLSFPDGPLSPQAHCAFDPASRGLWHNPGCYCGFRIVQDLPTLTSYLRYFVEHFGELDPNRPDDPAVALCVIECTAPPSPKGTPRERRNYSAPEHVQHYFGDATPWTPPREQHDHDGITRVTQLELGRRVYLAQTWQGRPAPKGLAKKIRHRYGVTVQHVPTVHQLPGMDYPGPPTPCGDNYHPSGKFGLYGGAGALIRHDDRFLIVKSYPKPGQDPDRGLWAPPGGAIKYHDENPWEAAQREIREEVQQTFNYCQPRGSVVHDGGQGWTFTTYAVDVINPEPLDGIDPQAAYFAGIWLYAWATAEELTRMARDTEMLMPEFRDALPDLLALFKEDT